MYNMSEEKNDESDTCVEANTDIRKNIIDGIYTLNRKDGRSKIWKYFVKIINDKGEEITRKVCCSLCYTVLSYNCQTTSNLLRHKCFTENKIADEVPAFKYVALDIKQKNEAKERTLSKIRRTKTYKSITNQYMQENAKIRYKVLTGCYKLLKKDSRSRVWNIFARIEDKEGNEITRKVCCKVCYAVLNQNPKCTSNLVKHKCYMRASMMDNSMDCNPDEKRTMFSDVKEMECNEEEEENTLLEELGEGSPSMMEKEEPLDNKFTEIASVDSNTYYDLKAEALKIFSQWCIENCRPFDLVDDAGLRRFINFIVSIIANYGTAFDIGNLLPSALAISQSIESEFSETLEKLRNEIEVDCEYGYGLTSKLWTDNCWQQKYITLTIHYIKNGKLISKLLGLNVINSDENMHDVPFTKLDEILRTYNFTYKDSIIVLDGTYNMTTALKKYNHISCVSHVLNTVIEKAIQEVKELKELHDQCLDIKKYFTNENTTSHLSTIFESLCLTKWNVSYYLLEAIEKNWLEIEDILKKNNESQKIANIQKKHLEDVLRILKPFGHTSKILEDEKYPTIHLVYAYVNGLKDSCSNSDEEFYNEVIQKFKEILIDQLQTTVISNFSITHKIALFLFPPANKLTQFSEHDKTLIKNKIITYLKPYVRTQIKKEITTPEPSVSTLPNTMISSYFKNFVTPPKSSNNCDEISSEIETYESLTVPYDDNFDILQWWHLRKTQFPLLYKLSCKILAAPASCASSEKIFSIVKYLAKNNTNIICNPKMFNQLIFLNFNSDKNFDIRESIIGQNTNIENEAIEQI